MKYRWIILVMTICFSPMLQAADGSSGCGPGWYVLKKNSLLSSVGRALTNSFLFPSTTLGMTFGTSNCTKHSIVMKDKRSLHFASENIEHLRHEIAQGDGGFLDAYLATFGCDVFSQNKIKSGLQSYYDDLFRNGDTPQAMEVVSLTGELILENRALTVGCGLS